MSQKRANLSREELLQYVMYYKQTASTSGCIHALSRRGKPDSVVAKVENGVIGSKEDLSQDPAMF